MQERQRTIVLSDRILLGRLSLPRPVVPTSWYQVVPVWLVSTIDQFLIQTSLILRGRKGGMRKLFLSKFHTPHVRSATLIIRQTSKVMDVLLYSKAS